MNSAERVTDEAVKAAICHWFNDPTGNSLDLNMPEMHDWPRRMRAAIEAADAVRERWEMSTQANLADAIARAGRWTCLVCDEPNIENTILTALRALAERAAN